MLGVSVLLGSKALAQPNFSQRKWIADTYLYPDFSQSNVWYYVPGPLRIIKDTDGKPEFRFVQMRYAGSRATADQGERRYNSIIKVGLEVEKFDKLKMDQLYAHFASDSIQNVQILPMPIKKVDVQLIFAAIGENNVLGAPQQIKGGFLEPTHSNQQDQVWVQKTLSQRLEPHSSQAFRKAFEGQQNILSVFFMMQADGIREGVDTILTEKNYSVRSESLPITIDHKRWPDLLAQVDINESIPPEYAALDVYCFDFNNELREDLYAKQIEIRATGIGKEAVKAKIRFKADEADTYARSVRFPYAVNMAMPFHYRIMEIKADGDVIPGRWQKRKNWHQILDITSH